MRQDMQVPPHPGRCATQVAFSSEEELLQKRAFTSCGAYHAAAKFVSVITKPHASTLTANERSKARCGFKLKKKDLAVTRRKC